MSKGLGDDIYSGAASFGRIRAIFGVIFGTLIGICLIVGGFYALAHKTKLTDKTTGIVVDSNNNPTNIQCLSTSDKDTGITYQCNFRLQYTVNKEIYYAPINTNSSTNYSGGTEITLYYDPNSPNNASLQQDDYHTIGFICIAAGLFILLFSWIGLWIILRYKFAAAASGAAGAIGMFKNI